MNQKEVNLLYSKVAKYDTISKKHYIAPEFIKNETRVYNQALRHNIWLEEIDLINSKFPNESEAHRDYRNKNKRQFTKEVSRKALQGIISTLSNVPIEVQSNNTKFNDWLNSLPFYFKSDKLSFLSWSINNLIPYCFIDPNCILVPFPLFRGEFDVINIEPKMIPYDKRYIDDKYNYLIILDSDNKNFWVADKQELYYVITGQTNKYELIYTHNLGELPFTYAPGISSFDKNTNKNYNESILSSTYEYLDESLISFATDQAVRVKMNSILVRPGLKCGNVKCDAGQVIDENGKSVTCKSCGGSGVAKRPSDLDDWVVLPADILQGDSKNVIKPEYINPDTSVAEFHSKTWKEYLNEGKKSIGIDALIDKSESGEAMKKRLASFEEFISYLIFLTYKSTSTKFFELCHKLLNKNQSDWKDFPTIKTPRRIEIKTPEILKEAYKNAVGGEKIQAALDYYISIYQDNPILLRTAKIMVENYPASIEESQDIQSIVLLGVYTKREVAKAKRSFLVIKKIVENLGTIEKTDEQIFNETEIILNKLIPDRIEVITE